MTPSECNDLLRQDVKKSSIFFPVPCRILSHSIRTLRTSTPGTCTWGFETTGTDLSVAFLVLRWTWWREFPMTTIGPSSKLLYCGKGCECSSEPVLHTSSGSLLIYTSSRWPQVSDNKCDVSHDSDGNVEIASICHVVLNRNTNTEQPETQSSPQMTDIASIQWR